MSGRLARRAALAPAALALLSAPAQAHLVQTGAGAFYDGLAHVLVTPADLLVVVALGLLAGLRGKEAARAALFVLPAAWLAGAVAGAALPAAGANLALWSGGLAVVACGALVAVDARLSRAACLGLGVLALGLQSAAAFAGARPEPLALAGAGCAVFILVTLAGALVVSHEVPWQRVAVRVAGSWIAASGLLMSAWLLRAPA